MLFGDTETGTVDKRARNDMNRVYGFADRDIRLALRHEFGDRHDPVELAALLGFFVEACWDKFWAAERDRKEDTLADFRAEALKRVEKVRMQAGPVSKSAEAREAAKQEARDAALLAYDAYGDAFDIDLERLQLFPGAHTRLAETAEVAAGRLFKGDTDVERGARMLIGRLHGYMRAAVWYVEKGK